MNQDKMISVVFIHHSSDLYGSDKVLLSLVTGLDRNIFKPRVVIPGEGPLYLALKNQGIETHIIPLALLGRATFSMRGVLGLPFIIYRSIRNLDKLFRYTHIDIVHSNTLAVLSGAFWAKCKKVTHVWHIHEIISHPRSVDKYYPRLVYWLSDRVITNSLATKKWISSGISSRLNKTDNIWNGINRTVPFDKVNAEILRNKLLLRADDILVLLVGRINRWKGQQLLVDAAEILWNQGCRNIHYVMMGSPPSGQDHYYYQLRQKILRSIAQHNITVMDYKRDIWGVWDACDIAVVPSLEPEPFGMVAIEAMAAGKPVIAASHGGLQEIIEDNITGLLFPPGDAPSLARKIYALASDASLREYMGVNARKRQDELFNLNNFITSFEKLYKSLSAQ